MCKVVHIVDLVIFSDIESSNNIRLLEIEEPYITKFLRYISIIIGNGRFVSLCKYYFSTDIPYRFKCVLEVLVEPIFNNRKDEIVK